MLQEPTDELINIKDHTFFRSSGLVVFVAECNLIVFKCFDPVV